MRSPCEETCCPARMADSFLCANIGWILGRNDMNWTETPCLRVLGMRNCAQCCSGHDYAARLLGWWVYWACGSLWQAPWDLDRCWR